MQEHILVEQEQYKAALADSEKALAILTVTLKNQSKELEPSSSGGLLDGPAQSQSNLHDRTSVQSIKNE